MKREFVKAYCEKCERYLLDAPEGSEVFCPDCKKWQTVEEGVQKDE